MKTLLITLGFFFAASGSLASVCDDYAKLDDVQTVKTVDPAKDALSEAEKGMIQTTILVGNPGQPLTLEQAIREFTDADHGGSNGGDLNYSEIKVGTRKHTVVRVTYYPGDNEYGLLFQYRMTQHGAFVDLLGTVQDGDILCLKYEN